mmetsp:Transcript_47327/g.92323  ORF Transcript_47327/g.92323 Transcript_47327/m.92323 type:complete len:99 (-) Transcript_47327:7-303(-)
MLLRSVPYRPRAGQGAVGEGRFGQFEALRVVRVEKVRQVLRSELGAAYFEGKTNRRRLRRNGIGKTMHLINANDQRDQSDTCCQKEQLHFSSEFLTDD